MTFMTKENPESYVTFCCPISSVPQSFFVFHDIDIFEEQSYFIKYSLVCLYLMFSHDYSQAVHFW